MTKKNKFVLSIILFAVLATLSLIATDTELSGLLYTQIPPDVKTVEYTIDGDVLTYLDTDYNIIEVDGGERSGERVGGVAVDVGYGERIYYALTNEHAQLVYVLAHEVVLQDEQSEEVNSSGRYYNDEAAVPGTELDHLDQGHVIADSLGGVANAYNITPQNYIINRHGDQAYMEKIIRDAGGCTDFIAVITYPDTDTMIPSEYRYSYFILGSGVVDEFANEADD